MRESKLLTAVLMSGALVFAGGCMPDPAEPAAEVSIQALGGQKDFGKVKVGSTAQLALTISNEGNADATLQDITTEGLGLGDGFALVGGTCANGTTLHAGKKEICTLAIAFAPSSVGIVHRDLSARYTEPVPADSKAAPVTKTSTAIELTGTGGDPNEGIPTNAHVTITGVTGADFGTVAIGNPTAMIFSVLNDGLADATLAEVTTAGLGLGGDFALTGGNCHDGLVLRGGKSENCTLILTYSPSVAGQAAASAQIRYLDASSGSPQASAALSLEASGALDCVNYPQLSLCPAPAPQLTVSGGAAFDYGNVVVGTSQDHTFTIANTGGAAASLGLVTEAGLGLAQPFSLISGTCASEAVLAPKTGSCTLVIRYAPAAAGASAASVALKYVGATTQTMTLSLAGTGQIDCFNYPRGECPTPSADLSISDAATYNYGSVAIGSYAEHVFRVTNNGNANAILGSINDAAIGLAAPFVRIGGSCATGSVVTAKGGSCTIEVRYTPTAQVTSAAALDVAYSGGTSSHAQRAITAKGVVDCFNYPQPGCPAPAPSFTISDGPQYDYGNVAIGANRDHTFTITNTGNADGDLGGITDAGLGLGAPFWLNGGTCATGAKVAAKGGSCTIIVRYVPTAQLTQSGSFTVRYSQGTSAYSVSRGILGKGIIDCANYPQPSCPAPAPRLVISPTSVNFGTVALETVMEATVTVNNQGSGDAVLGTVSTAGLGLSGPFSFVSGSCYTGMPIPPGNGSCTLRLRYTPTTQTTSTATASLQYQGPSGAMAPATVSLSGAGILNCGATPALHCAYNDGVDDAYAVNQSEAARGTADGTQAAYTAGWNAGYQATYEGVYNSHYTSAYNTAYYSAYDSGYYDGSHDYASCSSGTSDGAAAGKALGQSAGQHDGYAAGYDDGHAEGYGDGYEVGYADGEDSCDIDAGASAARQGDWRAVFGSASKPTVSARLSSIAATTQSYSDPNQTTCYQRGYSATLDPNAYINAYNAASHASAPYNAGYQDGAQAAQNEASAAGSSDGARDGRAQGLSDGYAAGQEDYYNSCYTSAYNSSYTSWYQSYYASYYEDGADAGYSDGYEAGYYDGYEDGAESCEDGASLAASSARPAAAKLPRSSTINAMPRALERASFGTGKSWVRKGPNGVKLDLFVEKPVVRGVRTDARVRSEARRLAKETLRPGLLSKAHRRQQTLGPKLLGRLRSK